MPVWGLRGLRVTVTKRIDGQDYVVCLSCGMRILLSEYEGMPHMSWCVEYKRIGDHRRTRA